VNVVPTERQYNICPIKEHTHVCIYTLSLSLKVRKHVLQKDKISVGRVISLSF
jgi:hypothetical protein